MAVMYGGARLLIPFTGATDHKEEGERKMTEMTP